MDCSTIGGALSEITQCRACSSDRLKTRLDLGEQYLSDFRDDDSKPAKYPLVLAECQDCLLAQLRHSAPPSELYHERYSFKSGVSPAIGRDLDTIVTLGRWSKRKDHTTKQMSWLDIASNDGTLLSYVPEHFRRVGIDPLVQFADEARGHADEIVVNFFSADAVHYEQFDIITSVSMFYDLDDPNRFVEDFKKCLAPNGVWICQQNDLQQMIRNNSFDNISHEHLTYWSLSTFIPFLERGGLRVVESDLSAINGGCFRAVICRQGELEKRFPLSLSAQDESPDWRRFGDECADCIIKVRNFVESAVDAGKAVLVYGASTRGAVIWQAAGLDVQQLPYVVERNPAKVGKIMSAVGAPIISEEDAREMRPDYMLVGPWWLRDDIVAREADYLRRGGKLVFPLPSLEIVSA